MKFKLYIFLLLQLTFSISYSQRTIREYWDRYHKEVRIEFQVNSMGVYNGYYRTYYAIGGYEKTGFYTNGQQTGLWSQYHKGSSKPYWQDVLVLVNGEVHKTMTKEWFVYGPDAGKLKEWREWSVDEDNENGHPLLLKEVIYSNLAPPYFYSVKYYLQSDYDIRRNLPVEKRYKKTYYPNGKIQYQWIFKKESGTTEVYNKIETSYDESGKLTEIIIRNEKDEIVTTNGVTPADERDTYSVNKATFLFRGIDKNVEDTLTSIEEGTILSINMNDQKNPRFPGLGLTQFFKVIYKGKTGYVYSKDLTFVSNNKSLKMAPLVETDKYKVDETTYLFREPDLFSDTLIEVEKGTDLTTKSIESKDFKQVTHKGITGYIYFLTLSPLSK